MIINSYAFGSITIDGTTHHRDVLIDRGEVRNRQKKPSKKYTDKFGHTPVSLEEDLPWTCRRLVIGTGAMGELPVMDEVKQEARRRRIKLMVLPTKEAVAVLKESPARTNALIHITC